MREVVIFAFVLIHIVDGVFLIRKGTFLEKFHFLCNLVSYRGE